MSVVMCSLSVGVDNEATVAFKYYADPEPAIIGTGFSDFRPKAFFESHG